MQKTLTNMDTWTRHNNTRINASKCKALTITWKKSPLNFIYKPDNVELERVSTEKDVEVNITNSLTWNTHKYAITVKANKLLWRVTCYKLLGQVTEVVWMVLLILMFLILFLLFLTAEPG